MKTLRTSVALPRGGDSPPLGSTTDVRKSFLLASSLILVREYFQPFRMVGSTREQEQEESSFEEDEEDVAYE